MESPDLTVASFTPATAFGFLYFQILCYISISLRLMNAVQNFMCLQNSRIRDDLRQANNTEEGQCV